MTDATLAVRPAPGRLPVLGHALQLRLRPLGFVTELRRYGDITLIVSVPRPVTW